MMPHFEGFSDVCVNLQGLSLAAIQLKVGASAGGWVGASGWVSVSIGAMRT